MNGAAGSSTPTDGDGKLRRELTLLDSTMINVGSMIGSGIFLVPVIIVVYLQSAWLVLIVWTVGGIVSLLGALSVAELGVLFPRAGGQYVYLSEGYGPLWGFLYGWTAFVVIMTASISAIGVGFASYLGYLIPLSPWGIKLVAIGSIVILTAINCLGVKLGALIQNIFTFYKMATLAVLALLGLFFGSFANLAAGTPGPAGTDLVGSFGLALVAVLWAYDGWIEVTFVAGEVKDPRRTLPRSLIISTLLVVAAYILVNFSYIYVLSIDTMSDSTLVAVDAAAVMLGSAGAVFAVVGVIAATMGSNNGFILTGARIYYAMATENLFFKSLGRVHPKYHTPIPSLIAQGVWASLLVLTSTFNELITYVIFVSWIFYALSVGAVMVLRRKRPDLPRPYRTWGYPLTPILFILFSLYLVVNTVIENPGDSVIGIGIIALGIPAYFYWKAKGATGVQQ